jgi:hypothetical protein
MLRLSSNLIARQASFYSAPKNAIIPFRKRTVKVTYKELLVLQNKASRVNSIPQKIGFVKNSISDLSKSFINKRTSMQ